MGGGRRGGNAPGSGYIHRGIWVSVNSCVEYLIANDVTAAIHWNMMLLSPSSRPSSLENQPWPQGKMH